MSSAKPQQYRKKPVLIEAMGPLTFDNAIEICTWCGGMFGFEGRNAPDVTIETLEGVMTASQGDYVIRGVKGEFYPCKPDIFEATYETA